MVQEDQGYELQEVVVEVVLHVIEEGVEVELQV